MKTDLDPKASKDKSERPLPSGGTHEASYKVGKANVNIRVEAPPGTRLQITLESQSTEGAPLEIKSFEYDSTKGGEAVSGVGATRRAALTSGIRQAYNRVENACSFLYQRLNWDAGLFGLAIAIYLLVRFIGLTDYPIFFFTDEAVQTILAEDFLRDGLHGYDHVFLPTFFINGYQYNLGTSVYLQVLPFLLLGKSVWVTRGASVLVTLIAAVSVGLILKKVFHTSYSWIGILLLSVIPAWFLHSRTAFETSLATSFYAGFLYFYLRYRTDSLHNLYPAVVMAALTFYSYSPARMVILLTGVLLLLSDLSYHWQQRRVVVVGLGLTLLLALPFLRFLADHPDENVKHLKVLDSYWVAQISLTEKLSQYFSEYLRGLDPLYWYLPHDHDLARHMMNDYGHLPRITIPLMFIGMGITAWRVRKSTYRTLLIALLVAPSGAALVARGITRALIMVIPAALLTALGIIAVLRWLEKRFQAPRQALAMITFIALVGMNFWLLREALVNGSLWHNDYGLCGMQYGARQIFTEIDEYLKDSPDTDIILSPSWANGTDIVARFFFSNGVPFSLGSIDGYFIECKPLDEETLFIMIPKEYERVQESGKFTDINVEKILPYPNGKPGFYFVHLRYVDNIEEIFQAEHEERQVLQEEAVFIGKSLVQVRFPYLDMGSIKNVFDGNLDTLIRTLEANPLRLEIDLPEQRKVNGMEVHIGGTATKVTIELQDEDGEELLALSKTAMAEPDSRTLSFNLKVPLQVSHIRLAVDSINDSEPAHVHLWEVSLK